MYRDLEKENTSFPIDKNQEKPVNTLTRAGNVKAC